MNSFNKRQLVAFKKRRKANAALKFKVKRADEYRAFSPAITVSGKESLAPPPEGIPYSEYLKTNYWYRLSNEVKVKARFRCERCKSKVRLNVHHKSYKNKGNYSKELKDLICVCQKCHRKIHHIH